MDEGAARQAWITYSTPLWKRAGRSDAWIAQNIQTEWASSKQDILRRYSAGDFGYVPEPPPPPPKPTIMTRLIEARPTFIAPALAPTPPYIAPKPQPEPAPKPISTPTIQATMIERTVTPTITSTISPETLGPKEEPKMTLKGIGIPVYKEPTTTSGLAHELITQAGIAKPSSQDEARALMGWLFYSIPLWKRAGYTLTQMATATAVWKTEAGKADVIRRYKANDFAAVGFPYEPPYELPEGPDYKEVRCPKGHLLRVRVRPPTLPPGMTIPPPQWLRCPIDNTELGLSGYGTPEVLEGEPPPAPTPTEDARINQILDTYEEQIAQLEGTFDEARAAELYNSPYAVIHEHALKILTQLERLRTGEIPMVSPYKALLWTVNQKIRLERLISRVKILITNCRTAAGERKPLLTPTEAVQQTTTDWITKYLQQSQQTGTPGLIDIYPLPGLYPVNGKPLVPTSPTLSPLSILRGTEPQAMPDYSVQERFAALTGQEPWELAAAELAPAPSRLPYYIMGGLGVVALVAYIKKKGAKR